MLVLRRSKAGLVGALIFLAAFLGLLAWVWTIASKNPADSGESAILLLPFTLPWTAIIPPDRLGPFSALGAVLLNTVLVYLACGGLRFGKKY